jgi:hypothetical protein
MYHGRALLCGSCILIQREASSKLLEHTWYEPPDPFRKMQHNSKPAEVLTALGQVPLQLLIGSPHGFDPLNLMCLEMRGVASRPGVAGLHATPFFTSFMELWCASCPRACSRPRHR